MFCNIVVTTSKKYNAVFWIEYFVKYINIIFFEALTISVPSLNFLWLKNLGGNNISVENYQTDRVHRNNKKKNGEKIKMRYPSLAGRRQ